MPGPMNDPSSSIDYTHLIHRSETLEGRAPPAALRPELHQWLESAVFSSLPAPEIKAPPRVFGGSRPNVLKGGKTYPWIKNT